MAGQRWFQRRASRAVLMLRAATVVLCGALIDLTLAGSTLAAAPTPTPGPATPPAQGPAGPGVGPLNFTGFAIQVPRDGTIIAQALPSAAGIIVSDFGIDQPTHSQLIADAAHSPGAYNVVGTFTAGTQLVFYISNPYGCSPTCLSTGDHAHIVPDGTEAWNIGWEDWTDFDYDDAITRICYQRAGLTGCPRDADGTFGLGPLPSHVRGEAQYVAYRVEPVNTATGNYTNEVTDLRLPGRGLAVEFRRTYNSLSTAVGTLGLGWTHTFAAHLELLGGGAVAYISGDGARSVFVPDGGGGFLRPPGQLAVLSSAGGGFDLLTPEQIRYHFDASGVLQTITDRNGNIIGSTYVSGRLTQVTDTVGRAITLAYDPNGRLSGLAGAGLTVGFTYDASGRLETVTDVRGFTTRYTYDANGRLATIIDANNHRLVLNTYGADGRVSEQVDARGNHTTFAWNATSETSTMTDARGGTWIDRYAGGILLSSTDPLGNVVRYGFNADLQASAVIDGRGYEIDSVFDAAGNLTTRVFFAPINQVERYTYDAQNNLLTSQDRNNRTTAMTYDAAGNLRTVTGPAPLSPLTTYNYDPAGTGLLFSLVDPRGKTTTFGYDSQANRNRTTTPLGFSTTTTYDPAGRMLTRVDPRGNVQGADPAQYTTTFTVDGAGNLLTVTDPLNQTTSYGYDPAGNRTVVTDALNHTTSYGYDAANELTSVTDPRLKVTAYTYDAVGNLATRTDALLHTTTYGYDFAGRLTSETRPLNRLWTYEYDANGNRTKIVDAIGNSTPQTTDGTTVFTYDNLDRLTGIAYNGTSSASFGYDGNGNRTSMFDNGTPTSYTYDEMNRMTRALRSTTLEIDYTYDPAGNVLTRTPLGGSAVSYTYDDDGRMATMTAGGQTTSYAYDAAGNLLVATLPAGNGYVETRTYDRAGRRTEVKNTKGATTLSKATYTLDPVGNPTTIVSTTGTTTLTYDELDRLTQACYTTACTGPGDNFRRYTYDDVGNRLTEVQAVGTTTYAYDALDELTATSGPGGNVAYGYDLDGHETAAGSRTFTYDVAGRLATTTLGNTTSTYTYDGDGWRLSAATGPQAPKTTRFLWDVNRPLAQVVRELDGNLALIREYRYGLELVAMQSGGSVYYFHHDGLGSITNLTSSSGVTQWTYQYHPYGTSRTTTKNNNQAPANLMQFTGQYLDPTGLYHLRARQYEPGTGRFLTTDPLQPAPSAPAVSSYLYALGNPVRFVDPSGWESQPASNIPSAPAVGPITNVRFPRDIPGLGGCHVAEYGSGLGFVAVGLVLEVGGGATEILSVGFLTPVSAAEFLVGGYSLYEGVSRLIHACSDRTGVP